MAAVTVSGEVTTAGVKENEFWGGELSASEDYITNGAKRADLHNHQLVIIHVNIGADGDTYTNANLADRISAVAFQGDDNAVPELAQAFISNKASGVVTFDTNTATNVQGWLWMLVYNGDNMGRRVRG